MRTYQHMEKGVQELFNCPSRYTMDGTFIFVEKIEI